MSWVFVVVKDNVVEQVKVFQDFWEGSTFADNFIKRIEPSLPFYPAYNRGETYRNDNLTVGLYLDKINIT